MFWDAKHNSSFNLKRKIHLGFTTSWKSWWGVRQDSISCKSRFICLIEAWQQQKYLLPLKTRQVKACLSMQKSPNKKSCYAFNWQETKLNIQRCFKPFINRFKKEIRIIHWFHVFIFSYFMILIIRVFMYDQMKTLMWIAKIFAYK